jgi:hypothetical protein
MWKAMCDDRISYVLTGMRLADYLADEDENWSLRLQGRASHRQNPKPLPYTGCWFCGNQQLYKWDYCFECYCSFIK